MEISSKDDWLEPNGWTGPLKLTAGPLKHGMVEPSSGSSPGFQGSPSLLKVLVGW